MSIIILSISHYSKLINVDKNYINLTIQIYEIRSYCRHNLLVERFKDYQIVSREHLDMFSRGECDLDGRRPH